MDYDELTFQVCIPYATTGHCRFGRACRFQHRRCPRRSQLDTSNVPCRYFERGICRYGEDCRFLHRRQASRQTRNAAVGRRNQRFILPTVGGEASVTQEEFAFTAIGITGDREEEEVELANSEHVASATTGEEVQEPSLTQKQEQVVSATQDEDSPYLQCYETADSAPNDSNPSIICGICLEEVTSTTIPEKGTKKKKKSRPFGLLTCCNHAFCVNCLMEWRKKGSEEATNRSACPTCRKTSPVIVPSEIFPSTDSEKEEIIRKYKEEKASLRCRRFNGQWGSCPFGSDCLYGHFNRFGADVKEMDCTAEELFRAREYRRSRAVEEMLDFWDVGMSTELSLEWIMALSSQTIAARTSHRSNTSSSSQGRRRQRGRDPPAMGDIVDDDDDDLDVDLVIPAIMAAAFPPSSNDFFFEF